MCKKTGMKLQKLSRLSSLLWLLFTRIRSTFCRLITRVIFDEANISLVDVCFFPPSIVFAIDVFIPRTLNTTREILKTYV